MGKSLKDKMMKAAKVKVEAVEAPETPAMEAAEEAPADHEIESAAETLMKAEQIKQNKKLMPHVHAHLAKKQHAINSIADLKKVAKELNEGSAAEEAAE
jgi:hypothetical protein